LNLTAPAVVSGRAIKQWLKEGKKGSIVNIASIAGFRGFTSGMPSYQRIVVKSARQRAHTDTSPQAPHTPQASMA